MRLTSKTMLQCSLLVAVGACASGSPERNDADLPDGEPTPEVDAETERDAEAEPDAGTCVDPACEPEPEECWSWPANVLHRAYATEGARTPTGWLEGERVWLANGALFELGPDGWVGQQTISGLFDFQRGEGWSAVLVRSEYDEPDWIQYRRDGEEWRRVDVSPAVQTPRLTAATNNGTHLYVRSADGVIARFDGESWETLVRNAPARYTAALAIAGDVLYDSHNSTTDAFEHGAFTRLPLEYGQLLWGDGEHVFFSGNDGGRTALKVGAAGSEMLPTAPGTINLLRTKGDQLAIQVYDRDSFMPHAYRLIDGQWQLMAKQKLLALDADGTLLVGLESGAVSLVAPDGSTRLLDFSNAPTGPLIGESLDALWARGAHGGLLRLAGDHWELVSGTETLDLKAIWRSRSGAIFLATSSEVYRLVDDAIEALPAPGLGDGHGLVGRGDDDVYLSSIDATAMLRVQHWDGASWSELEALATPTSGLFAPPSFEVRSLDAPCLTGSTGFLMVRHYVEAPDIDPYYGSHGLASTGGPWHRTIVYGEGDATYVRAVQFGPSDAPLALFTSLQPPTTFPPTEQLLHYDLPDPEQPDQIMESGTLDHAFIGGIAGDDLDHMVGVVEVDGFRHFVFRDGGAWRTRGTGALSFGGGGAAWYGRDAIGVADDDGVTICKR